MSLNVIIQMKYEISSLLVYTIITTHYYVIIEWVLFLFVIFMELYWNLIDDVVVVVNITIYILLLVILI